MVSRQRRALFKTDIPVSEDDLNLYLDWNKSYKVGENNGIHTIGCFLKQSLQCVCEADLNMYLD